MKTTQLFAIPMFIAIAACSSSSSSPGPEQDKGLTGGGEGTAESAPDTNPSGVPYPTDKIGTTPATGTAPGNRIANYKFLGYLNGDKSQGLQPVSLANYFDPEGRQYKLIHIQASGVWCIYCQKETEAVAPMKAKLDALKVVWLMSLAEGATGGTPSTKKDLDGWIAEYKAPFTHVLDPGNKNLGPFYNAAALPWNADVSAKTMEIIDAHEGAATTEAAILQGINESLAKAEKSTLK
jgi:hypothetical protein